MGPRGKQTLRVGVCHVRKDSVSRPALHHAAAIHDHHASDVLGDDPKVMRYQNQSHVALLHQVADQVEYLPLQCDVKRCGGLVGNQQIGAASQCHGDRDALALPT